MSAEAARFLSGFAQALSTMSLYSPGHPARERVVETSFEQLRRLLERYEAPRFSFLGPDVVFGQVALREMKEWEWGTRLANAGVQRVEFAATVTRDEFEQFLEEVLVRFSTHGGDSAAQSPERVSSIRFGAIGVRGAEGIARASHTPADGGRAYVLDDEAGTVRWMHGEVRAHGGVPLTEAESVVRSLALALHGEREMVIPLLQLKEFDQYTTTHSLNVSVLSMALAEFSGLGPSDVRAFGVAGLLHDLGKVRIPKDVLTKPGKLTAAEWEVMRRHPADGARIIFESDHQLDLASAVAYEHHIMINGGGYPAPHFRRECHHASKLVHICDVYDALRTRRPYREAWDAERVLKNITDGAGTDFDTDLAAKFTEMMRKWEPEVAVLTEPGSPGSPGSPGFPGVPASEGATASASVLAPPAGGAVAPSAVPPSTS